MKALFFILLLSLIALLGFSYRIATLQLQCSKTYEPAITNAALQSQALFVDKGKLCEQSYFAVSDLDMCLTKTDEHLPKQGMAFLRPIISNISVFLRNETKDIASIKAEHDERCKDYTRFMFNPPGLE